MILAAVLGVSALPILHLQAPRATLTLEVAATDDERRHGLMGRERLGKHRGMIFVFPGEQTRHFWMKDTAISLDMIFVRADRRISMIATNVPAGSGKPDNEIARRWAIARYVIEINTGEAQSDGLQKGKRLNFSQAMFAHAR